MHTLLALTVVGWRRQEFQRKQQTSAETVDVSCSCRLLHTTTGILICEDCALHIVEGMDRDDGMEESFWYLTNGNR
jgi:hypothetical protein